MPRVPPPKALRFARRNGYFFLYEADHVARLISSVESMIVGWMVRLYGIVLLWGDSHGNLIKGGNGSELKDS